MTQRKIKYFSQEEVKKIISDGLKNHNYKWYLLCIILAYTGARISEVLALQKKDIYKLFDKSSNQDHYYVEINTLKQSGKQIPTRIIPLYDRLKMEILTFVSMQKLIL